ncbi:ABC transporter permease [Rothia sp. AR01]|uniref:ABC transporter permease n=1 Tax=Rothia santali TaxID=2949643 RepID=A0A9X2HCV1_9MICC|nr:ABC transporter permease [Rothia santali]MCP3427026.1 ABC transporter permease [Rothia santali]
MSRQNTLEHAVAEHPALERSAPARSGAARGAWRTVAAREIVVRATDKTFLISSVVTVLLLVGAAVFTSFMGGRDSTQTVAVAGAAAGERVAAASELAAADGGDGLETVDAADPAAARALVADDEADLALYEDAQGWTLVTADGTPGAAGESLMQSISAGVQAENAAQLGVDLEALDRGAEVTVEAAEGSSDGAQARLLGIVFAFVFYMAAITFGMAIAASILEEKQNRVVEIIAASIPVGQLLTGKLMANMALAFSQLLVFGAVSLAAATFLDLGVNVAWALTGIGWFVGFFVLGFAILAALWAVVGAMADRTEDMNASTGPVVFLLVAVLAGGMAASGTLQTVLSYLPVFSSVIMPMRLVEGSASWWEAVIAAAIALVTVVLVMVWCGRLYRRAVMRTGQSFTWAQVLRRKV